MQSVLFITLLSFSTFAAILFGFKFLPKEQWQIMAVIPLKKNDHGQWSGLNLTYYGFLIAAADTLATALFLILSRAAGMPVSILCILIVSVLALCLPASKIVARIVEKKRGTLTVGGAVFTGTLVAPWMVLAANHFLADPMGINLNVGVFLACMSVAYAYGEGLGRLACISFGCCYGKPLSKCSPVIQKLFSRFYLTFYGPTKKISYASGLEGEKTIPIQILTAVLYCTSALVGTILFLNGYIISALSLTIIVTQAWRFISEFFRADFRGSFSITPYQIMALITMAYAIGTSLLFNQAPVTINLDAGLKMIANPWILFFLQGIGLATFIYTARSVVTRAQITFGVNLDKI